MSQENLLQKIKSKPIPRHVAIIMDGNGRWAKQRKVARIFGHRAGTESVREVIKASIECGLEILTLYTFSTENWSRPKTEVSALMSLLCRSLRREVKELQEQNIQLRTIGETGGLPPSVQREISACMQRLNKNTGLQLVLALNYGGRQEIVQAVNQMIHLNIPNITEENFNQYLYTKDLKDPDLIIRTSGELRISNFLLYQSAYSEYYSTPVLWPDFRKKDFYEAILEYQNRERRYGGHP